MMQWDSRMQNNHSVKILKAAIPFLDIDIGEKIDFRGLLTAIRPFASGQEAKILDMILQFFQIQDMMEMAKDTSVPNTVAISADSSASISVVASAFIISSS